MRIKIAFLLLCTPGFSFAQDSVFARKMVDKLTSPHFWGRGYTNNGVHKTAAFLGEQFEAYGVLPMSGTSYLQEYSYPVNTFPGKMKVSINGIKLIPGKEFIISPNSKGVKAKGLLTQTDSIHFIDTTNRIVVALEDKLTWSVARQVVDYTVIQVNKKALKQRPSIVSADIKNKQIADYKTANVCGIVKGSLKPDSFIVITAHYDHLGGMGSNTYFPGANDNASGLSELLGLAKYYGAHQQLYTMAFICFSGEEAGLLGSKYFTENPLIPLKKIRFLINLDLNGTGIDGITVVNASIYPKEFAAVQKINNEGNYFVKIYPRGKAANSDHYPFTKKGYPPFSFTLWAA